MKNILVQQTALSDGEMSLNVLNTSTNSMWTSTRSSHRDGLLLWFAKDYTLRLSRQPGSHSDHACWTSFPNSNSHRCPGTQLKSWQIAARRTTASWPVAMAAYIPRRNSKNKSFKPSSLISQKQGNACTRMAEFAETITRRRWLHDQCPCSWYWILPLPKRIQL
jgi:hypothetical protein